MTVTDLGIVEDLDFDYVPPCESVSKHNGFCGGENPAEYRISFCCEPVLACGTCKDITLTIQEFVWCRTCGEAYPSYKHCIKRIDPI